MTPAPTAIRTVRWMVRDTFRQSLYTKLFWVMLGLTGLCTLFCLSISVHTPPERPRHPDELPIALPESEYTPEAAEEGIRKTGLGTVSFGFGLVKDVPIGRNKEDSVRQVQLWLAGVLADSAGVLLVLLWTAGFLPTFLEPQSITVLLAKPVSRWSILLGKYVGVVLFVMVQAVIFVSCTWVGLGLATGVWDGTYWFAVPLLVTNFAVFYAFSAFLAVCTRSTVVSVFGTLLFWTLCFILNITRHKLAVFDIPQVGPASLFLLDAGYWCLPKPLDFSTIFFDAMGARDFSMAVPEMERVKEKGQFFPEMSVLTSLGFAAGVLAVAAYEFRTMDY